MKKTHRFKKTELLGLGIVLSSAVLCAVGYAFRNDEPVNKIIQFVVPLSWVAYGAGNWLLSRSGVTKHKKIELNDERNIKIREKSAYYTFFVTLYSLFVAGIIFVVLEMWLATSIIVGMQTVHVVSYFAFRLLNSKKL